MNLKDWAAKGNKINIFKKNIFVVDEGNSEETLVILHGYATSSFDYYKVLPELSKHYRVVIQDFIGFGFSFKPREQYFTIQEQADATIELWKTLELKNITIFSHNFGTSILGEIITRKNAGFIDLEINKIIFSNGLMPFEDSKLFEQDDNNNTFFTQKFTPMLASYSFFMRNMKSFFYDDQKLTNEEILWMWKNLERNDGLELIDFITNYVRECKLFRNRWMNALEASKITKNIIWGKNDSLAFEDEASIFAEEIACEHLYFIDNCGHYPMLEKPKEFVNLVLNEETQEN